MEGTFRGSICFDGPAGILVIPRQIVLIFYSTNLSHTFLLFPHPVCFESVFFGFGTICRMSLKLLLIIHVSLSPRLLTSALPTMLYNFNDRVTSMGSLLEDGLKCCASVTIKGSIFSTRRTNTNGYRPHVRVSRISKHAEDHRSLIRPTNSKIRNAYM